MSARIPVGIYIYIKVTGTAGRNCIHGRAHHGTKIATLVADSAPLFGSYHDDVNSPIFSWIEGFKPSCFVAGSGRVIC